MSSIGPGPGISTGHIELNGIRPVGGAEPRLATGAVQTQAQAPAETPPATSNEAATQVSTTALDAGQVPVDGERVSQIRKAIQSGTYPIYPTKISDAMIAAGIMLQVRG